MKQVTDPLVLYLIQNAVKSDVKSGHIAISLR